MTTTPDLTVIAHDLSPVPARSGIRAWYAKPSVQVCMIALTCFACPGMFNALSGIGGGGQVDPTVNNNGAVALYSTFAVTSFFSGTINNRIGSRLTLSLGAMGYALYIGSLLSYNINKNGNFVIAAGAILGVCAGMLWTAQGSMTLAYATEKTKGRLFALFWSIFNIGAVLGSAIELGITYNSTSNTVANGVYAIFLVIASLGAFLPHFLVDPGRMIRTDGTRVVIPLHPSWKSELIGLYKTLRGDWMILFMLPYFLASNWFYTWQFNSYNGALFTLRTRSLNSLLYWLFQVFGSLLFGTAIDSSRFRRVNRAWGGLLLVTLLAFCTWGGALHYQKSYTRADVGLATFVRTDFKDAGYAGKVVLYIWMGIMDAIWQNFAYWLMGSMSNSSAHLAYLVGLYKAVQSAGAAGVYRLDSEKTAFLTELIVSWTLCAVGILFVTPVILFRVTDHTVEREQEIVVGDSLDGSTSTSTGTAILTGEDEKRPYSAGLPGRLHQEGSVDSESHEKV